MHGRRLPLRRALGGRESERSFLAVDPPSPANQLARTAIAQADLASADEEQISRETLRPASVARRDQLSYYELLGLRRECSSAQIKRA